ncbi:MAG: DUF975 family protein [Lachnospiraceae bacterium]|nr:DUF975 family protein [Lachnospiraceae bacterium]
MDFTREELKAQSKQQMEGKIGGLILAFFVAMAVSGAIGAIPFVGSIATIITTPVISVGLVKICLGVTYGDEPNISTLFEGFGKDLGRTLATFWLVTLFTFLWSCLFIIPGIIMSYAYSQTIRIMIENPDMSPMDCIRKSKEIMNGRKMDLFVLHLSFILWILLIMVTCGIASIYVAPYMNLTETNFYHRVKQGGDGTDIYTAPEGSVFGKVSDVADNFSDAVTDFSDKVEDVTENITDKIDDKFSNN